MGRSAWPRAGKGATGVVQLRNVAVGNSALMEEAGVDALRPGVTGWAQIHGRDDIPLDRKVAYDRWYLEHLSPWLDLWIALRTPFVLLSSRGVF